MVGHLVHLELERAGLPASLSATMLDGFLRTGLGFDGVLVSDDMAMRAISSEYGFEDSVRLALGAGVDLYVHSNSGPYQADFVDTYHSAVRAALADGTLSQASLEASAARLANW